MESAMLVDIDPSELIFLDRYVEWRPNVHIRRFCYICIALKSSKMKELNQWFLIWLDFKNWALKKLPIKINKLTEICWLLLWIEKEMFEFRTSSVFSVILPASASPKREFKGSVSQSVTGIVLKYRRQTIVLFCAHLSF